MHVEYVAHSGSDLLVVDCARASFGKQSEWVDVDDEKLRTQLMLNKVDSGTIKSEKILAYQAWLRNREAELWSQGDVSPVVLKYEDYNLINFLAREKHVLPFRHPTVTLRCKAPIVVARQLGKHQAGMSWSEESRRYITSDVEFYKPTTWRKKADNVKQGSSDETMECPEFDIGGLKFTYEEVCAMMAEYYEGMMERGIAPEQARMILPQAAMTTWVWTGTLLAWVHMLKLRLNSHTQAETREFASKVADIIKPLYPVSYEALMKESG